MAVNEIVCGRHCDSLDTGKNMKAISLWEPWATAMALGLKQNETRHWPTSHRGELAICSAKRPMDEDSKWVWEEIIKPLNPNAQPSFGAILCVVDLFDCVKAETIIEKISAIEYDLGNYESGRFVWRTKNVRPLPVPIPIKGAQGFFNLPPVIEVSTRGQI